MRGDLLQFTPIVLYSITVTTDSLSNPIHSVSVCACLSYLKFSVVSLNALHVTSCHENGNGVIGDIPEMFLHLNNRVENNRSKLKKITLHGDTDLDLLF